jgi:hypothetical protein
MTTPLVTSEENFYTVLQVPKNATAREIKDARNRMSLEHHPDKGGSTEQMQKINLAASTLLDPEKRKEYDETHDDDTQSSAFVSGSLHCGFKLSDEFKTKIKIWKKEGPPKVRTAFRHPDMEDSRIHPSWSDQNSPKRLYEKLLNTPVPIVSETLSTVLPQWIGTWSFEMMHLAVPKEILNSSFWSADFPPLPSAITLPTDYDNEIVLAKKMIALPKLERGFSPPSVSAIKGSLERYFAPQPPSAFYSEIRRFPGTQVPLGPESVREELGYIPQVTVEEGSAALNTTATHCDCCENAFGLFRWRYTCSSCGNAECSSCLEFRRVPEYVDPVRVCASCAKNSTSYQDVWISALDLPSVRKKITSKYLTLISDFAKPSQFLEWVRLFISDQRYELAIACNYFGKGDWMDLAKEFIPLKKYEPALICLNQIYMEKGEWVNLGNSLAKTNPRLALLCYKKAALEASQYEVVARSLSDHFIGKVCLIIAMEMVKNKKAKQELLYGTAEKAIQEKKYDLAAFCLILLKTPIDKWIEFINAADMEAASAIVQVMKTHLSCDWRRMQFTPDKDHLRWQFLSHPQFNLWLDYLIPLLQKCDGRNAIPYFRYVMRQENFMEHRDRFLAQGEYTRALICHRLIPNGLSWTELAQKWRNKNEMARFACYLSCPEDIEKMGDLLFQAKDYTLALRCYLFTNNFHKIYEQAKNAEYEIRLLYQFAILKYCTHPHDIILNICSTLQTNPDHQPTIQKMLIAALQHPEKRNHPLYHRMLADTGLDETLLLGLVDVISPLCKQPDDEKWLASAKEKILKKFELSIYRALNSYSYSELAQVLDRMSPLTLPAVNEVLRDLKLDTLERCPRKSMGLILRAVSFLADPKGSRLLEAMNDVSEAMLGDPREDTICFCVALIEKVSIRMEGTPLQGPGMTEVQYPKKSEFTDRLKRTPHLRMINRSEEAIGKFDKPFEAAMSYIDLSMAIPSAAGTVGSFLSAALELLKAQQSLPTSSPKRYAYMRAIVELAISAYVLGNRHLCPTTQLYTIRSSIAILTSTFGIMKQITATDQMILDQLYREANDLAKIVPLIMGQMVSIYDLIYVDLLNREFLNQYLPMRRDAVNPAEKPQYQYYMLEGAWKGWLDEEKFPFEKERTCAMNALLSARGNSMEDVEDLMSWPALSRDSEGWLPPETVPLNLADGPQFSHVEGIRFNLETGDIAFMLVASNNPSDSLFDMSDVAEIMKRGICGAQFTLDPPDPNLPYHPFQNMIYAPKSLSGTNYLGTMLHADLLLKMLSMGKEISAKKPFALRNADEHLLQRLPEKLRRKFTKLREKHPFRKEAIHRFWIEAGQLFYKESQSDNVVSFTFGDCEMSVKKHLMERDSDGNLVDTKEDDDPDSPESKFANLMTKEYDRIGRYFPELARLRELAKIQAMSVFAQSIHQSVQTHYNEINIPESKINTVLKELRAQVKEYPQSSDSNVRNIAEQFLRTQNVYRYQITDQQWREIKNQIRNQCLNADRDCINQISNILSEGFHADHGEVHTAVKDWLNDDLEYPLVRLLKDSEEAFQRQKIRRIFDTFRRAGIAAQLDKTPVQDPCTWVPAAFNQTDHFKVYGGVNMQSRLTSIGKGTLPPFRGGGNIGNSGASGNVARHIVTCDANGKMYATTIGVYNNQAARTLDLAKHLQDQWSHNNGRSPNVAGYWKSYVGSSESVGHYTKHHNGSVHIHRTSGWTSCHPEGDNKNYTSIFRGGDRTHRCEEGS